MNLLNKSGIIMEFTSSGDSINLLTQFTGRLEDFEDLEFLSESHT